MAGFTNLELEPLVWSQSICQYSNIDTSKKVEGAALSLTARPLRDCEIVMLNGATIRDFQFKISILRGLLRSDERRKCKLSKMAIGGFWLVAGHDSNLVHGWFYFNPENYAVLWDQVRFGDYVENLISLGVETGEDDVWTGNPLSIVNATFSFNRKPKGD